MSEPKQFTSLVSEGKNPKYAILRFNALKGGYEVLNPDKNGMPQFTYSEHGIIEALEELNEETK
jgi:hypothetical protein